MCQWKNFENRSIFDKDMDNHKVGRFLRHSVHSEKHGVKCLGHSMALQQRLEQFTQKGQKAELTLEVIYIPRWYTCPEAPPGRNHLIVNWTAKEFMIFWLSVQRSNCYAIRTPNYKKSELMLMRRSRAYGSSCSQLISVYFYPFHRTSLFCSQTSHKVTKILHFLGSRSCKVIDVDTINKHVTIACYEI